ncbi:hypothetical protein PYCCODRAFT_1508120 [Trametes coccinea BRFM310]|uniref:Uncharacterized protein n=1 Tax=Trametes coccinea (strain BRFM310) TaxID=1353009 RepID=A0A1Y2J2K1_TRAC3|nr:hypothetical protein PYCCODRAFT_1508120 [Trametes coccinea BRFM310]
MADHHISWSFSPATPATSKVNLNSSTSPSSIAVRSNPRPSRTQEEWKPDVKDAEPAILPGYAALPPSPKASANTSPTPAEDTHGSSPKPSPAPGLPLPPPVVTILAGTSSANGTGARDRRIFQILICGLLALVVPPLILLAASLAVAAVMLHGVGKVLEGVGLAVALGPELLYRALDGQRAAAIWEAVKGLGENRVAETGPVSL